MASKMPRELRKQLEAIAASLASAKADAARVAEETVTDDDDPDPSRVHAGRAFVKVGYLESSIVHAAERLRQVLAEVGGAARKGGSRG